MDTFAFLQGLRYIDTFFPSGSFAFSSGLETAVQEGAVQNSKDLHRYVTDYLLWGIGRCDAVALARAHGAVNSRDLKAMVEADVELDSLKLCQETRAASCQMGRSILQIAADQKGSSPFLRNFREEMDAGRSPGHLAIVWGLTLGSFGWKRQDAIAAFLYQTGVGFVSASHKLFPLGQREGQRLLESWAPLMESLSVGIAPNTPMTSWSPIHDIYAMRHTHLTTRLFRS